MTKETPWLHLRGQFTYHGEARICGTASGLTVLRDAIEQAIECRDGQAVVFASDGEGYGINVRRAGGVTQMGEPPYLDDIARELACHEREIVSRMEKTIQAEKKKRGQDLEASLALIWCRANGNPHTAAITKATARSPSGMRPYPSPYPRLQAIPKEVSDGD